MKYLYVLRFIKKILKNDFIKFVFTGALNTCFGYLLFSFCYLISENKTIALLISYILGSLFNYKTYSIIVFNPDDNRLIRFLLIYIFIYSLNLLSLLILTDIIGFNAYVGQIITLTYIPILLFFLLKKFVFHNKKNLL